MNDWPACGLLISPNFHGYGDAIAATIERRGIEMSHLQYPDADESLSKKLYYASLKLFKYSDLKKDIERLKLRRHSNLIDAFNEDVRRSVRETDPDFVLVIKGEFLRPDTVRWLRDETRVTTALWSYDELERLPYTAEGGRFYDNVYVFDPADTERFADNIVPSYLPLAHDGTKFDETTTEGPSIDVSFVGNLRDDRRRELLTHLASELDIDIQIWDSAWDWYNPFSVYRYRVKHRALGDRVNNQYVDHATINEIYNRSRICVNVHKSWKVKNGGPVGLNMRTFEIPGAGAFQLISDVPNIESAFEVGEELVTYDSKENLLDKVRYYLDNDEERERIAANGYQRAKDEHTFEHRIGVILDGVRNAYPERHT
ncbi:CgeB family protein [Halobacterium bonnevillei]|uniref:Glycosyltransferase n=1 Tax=Halobacterium bonnevillei TaxID=2692200 RepID=A0A6B0SN64_9EURY|nr:glycosyltransferase [Halobacterium bonnevillei]MXR19069.1 glycosyltransferase [Halobacterium bonnevillei]